MAWKAVGPVVKKVVDRIVDVGETGVAAPVVSRKNAEAEAPAKFTEQRQGEEKPATACHERMNVALRLVSSRCKSAHDPRRAPPRRADFHLVLVWSDGHAIAPRQQLRHERDDAGTSRIRGSS